MREKEIAERARSGVIKEEHIDWSTQIGLSPFTFDIMKMGHNIKMYKLGRNKVDDEVSGLVKQAEDKNAREKAEEAQREALKQQKQD